jgi:hypothetical protein
LELLKIKEKEDRERKVREKIEREERVMKEHEE